MQITNTVPSWLQRKYEDRTESCIHSLLQVSQWYHVTLLFVFFFFLRHLKDYLPCPHFDREIFEMN